LFITVFILFIFSNFQNNSVFCLRSNILQENVLNNYKYLYYGKHHVHLEEVINFYLNNSNEFKFKVSQYRYLNQIKFIRNEF
jgi:hypothetical protein